MADRPILYSAEEPRWRSAAVRLGVSIDEYLVALNDGKKVCGGCRSALARTPEFFGSDRRQFDGLRSRCRSCVSLSKKAHYLRTRPAQRARQLRYQQENRPRLYAYNAAWQRRRNAKLRAETITAYGGQCNCCGESEPIFLDLDHINNDGGQHRREVGSGYEVMLELRAQGWPKDRVQLLCCNCNQGKSRNGGICPHQQASHG